MRTSLKNLGVNVETCYTPTWLHSSIGEHTTCCFADIFNIDLGCTHREHRGVGAERHRKSVFPVIVNQVVGTAHDLVHGLVRVDPVPRVHADEAWILPVRFPAHRKHSAVGTQGHIPAKV